MLCDLQGTFSSVLILNNVLFLRYGISNIDAMIEGTSEDMTVVDAASLRRQVFNVPNSM